MPDRDYFELFGLPCKLQLDPDDLQRRFYALSRELHPDRYARATPAERERALQASAVLNDAYRTLRDPVARASYVLGGAGEERVPPELLEEVFEAAEALERGDTSARARFQQLLADTDAHLTELFAQHDAGLATPDRVRAALHRRRYLSKLIARYA